MVQGKQERNGRNDKKTEKTRDHFSYDRGSDGDGDCLQRKQNGWKTDPGAWIYFGRVRAGMVCEAGKREGFKRTDGCS